MPKWKSVLVDETVMDKEGKSVTRKKPVWVPVDEGAKISKGVDNAIQAGLWKPKEGEIAQLRKTNQEKQWSDLKRKGLVPKNQIPPK